MSLASRRRPRFASIIATRVCLQKRFDFLTDETKTDLRSEFHSFRIVRHHPRLGKRYEWMSRNLESVGYFGRDFQKSFVLVYTCSARGTQKSSDPALNKVRGERPRSHRFLQRSVLKPRSLGDAAVRTQEVCVTRKTCPTAPVPWDAGGGCRQIPLTLSAMPRITRPLPSRRIELGYCASQSGRDGNASCPHVNGTVAWRVRLMPLMPGKRTRPPATRRRGRDSSVACWGGCSVQRSVWRR